MTPSAIASRALILRARAEACPAVRIIDEALATEYFLAMARVLVAREERRQP